MLLDKYLAPENESAIFKNIPIGLRFHPIIRNILMTKCFMVKYRGPSNENYKRPQSHTIKSQATSFAIYYK